MKILKIIQCTNLGGMEQSALLLLAELQRLGHEVEVLSLNPIGTLGPLVAELGIQAHGVRYRGHAGWRSFLPLKRLLRNVRADAMIMGGHNLMAMLAIGSRWRHRRVVSIHYHHHGVKPDWAWRLIYRVAVSRFPVVVFPSQYIMEEAISIAPFLNQHARLIGYPIPVQPIASEKQKCDAQKRLGLRCDGKVVGNAGWLIGRKRWDVFLQVAALVTSKVPNVHFTIAGDGPERDVLKAYALKLGLENRVSWLGWCQDLSDFYRSLDVMLFNSDWDAMGRTPLEAMAYGVPAVASVSNGGLGEIIDCDGVGILLRAHDAPRLATHVCRLLLDPEAARTLGNSGRQRIAEIGSPQLHAERMLLALDAQ